MGIRSQILCVDDEKGVLSSFKRFFGDDNYEIFTAESGQDGLEILEKQDSIQLVISDYRMPGMDGIEFLQRVWARWPKTVRILISGDADAEQALSAINEGQIYKFFAKPWNDDEFRETVANALNAFHLRERNEALADELIEQRSNKNG